MITINDHYETIKPADKRDQFMDDLRYEQDILDLQDKVWERIAENAN